MLHLKFNKDISKQELNAIEKVYIKKIKGSKKKKLTKKELRNLSNIQKKRLHLNSTF